MKLHKKAYLHHPLVAIVVGFLVGMVLMYLIAKGVVPIAGIKIC